MENSIPSSGRRVRASCCAAVLVCVSLIVSVEDAAAQFWKRKSSATQFQNRGTKYQSGSRKKPQEINLFFVNADWAKVLNSVCDQSGAQLVMDTVPPGRFNRYDRKRYSQTEAVRILNRELEPSGFRLIEKSNGRFIDVVHLRDARAEYHRPELPNQPQHQRYARNDWAPERRSAQPRRAVHQISGRRGARETIRQASDVKRTFAGPARSKYYEKTTEAMKSLSSQQAKPKAPQPKITRVVQPRSRRAVDIARLIYGELKDRAELADRGPGGLPAFNVLNPEIAGQFLSRRNEKFGSDSKRVKFSVGIDSSRNELVISAPPELNHSISEMVRYLDTVTVERGNVLRLVATNSDAKAIASTLSPQLQFLAQNNQGKQQPPMKKEAPVEQTIPGTGPLPAQLAAIAIRGRVVIQYVQGVGLVVRGNQEDVDAVIRIIKELDRQAKLTTPNIEIHMLKFVNSAALAELLSAVYQQLDTIRTGGTRTGTTTTTQSTNTIGFIPVSRPNALLILASKAELKSVLTLIDELDRPVDPQKEFRVFRIKYAVASQVVANLNSLFQAQTAQGGAANQVAGGLGVRVRAVADVRTNSVIVEASPNDMNAVAGLIQKFDQEHIPSVSRIRVFPLKNAAADDLATLISSAIQSVINPPLIQAGQGGQGGGAGQSAQELRDAKSAVLEFMSSSGDNKRLIRSGILSDIRVTSNPQANSLVVTAPETSMKLMEELIKHLDTPSKLVAEIKVFTLANGDATAMTTLLNALFTGTTQQQQGSTVPLALADDASSGLVPLRFSVDARTNSIIAVGGAAALTVVEAVILRLDQSDSRKRLTQVVRLRNAPAADIANAINTFITAQQNLQQIDPNLITNLERLEKEIIVVSEPITNSLLLNTTPRYEKEMLDLIKVLDAAPPQVIIQAMLVEVELDNTDEFGIELGYQDQLLFDRGILGAAGTTTTSFNFNNQPLGNNPIDTSNVGEQSLTNFSLGRVNADLGYGGLVLSASSSSISALLRALSAKRTLHVLSRPQITTLDNQTAQIHVGQDVPIVAGVQTTANGSANPQVQQRETGIILTVTPRISPDGTIVMEVVAEKSGLSGQGVPIFTDANTGNVIEQPIINVTNARSTLSIPNGQTVVMGGMITKQDDTINRKVPWLGDIPYLGYAFRYDSTTQRRTELLIFLTPRIIRNDADSEVIKQIEAERMHYIERDVERLHGPLYAVPASDGLSGLPAPMTSRFSPKTPTAVRPNEFVIGGRATQPRRDNRLTAAGYESRSAESKRKYAPRSAARRERDMPNRGRRPATGDTAPGASPRNPGIESDRRGRSAAQAEPSRRSVPVPGRKWDSSWQQSQGERQAGPFPDVRDQRVVR